MTSAKDDSDGPITSTGSVPDSGSRARAVEGVLDGVSSPEDVGEPAAQIALAPEILAGSLREYVDAWWKRIRGGRAEPFRFWRGSS